jgi:tetratricopeptide (TPR) repeat protein
VLVFAGRMDEGWQLLEEAIARACDTCQEAEAARGYRMAGSSASELMEYDRAEHWLTEGVRYAENAELWNHRHYMAAHLAHVQWATGQWDAAAQTAQGALADGRGGITTWITAQYVLGYLAMGRGDWSAAGNLLREALATGERMAELQRLSPPLWGLAEAARCRGDHDTALTRCERGYQASAEVMDAACLFPYLLTGVRAHLARGNVEAAEEWSARVGAVLTARAIPGTLPAIGHGRGLILLARGDTSAAHQALESARESWRARRRFWEGTWALLDLAAAAAKARRRAERVVLGAFIDMRQIPDQEDGSACVLIVAAGVPVPVEHIENLGNQAHAHTVIPHAPFCSGGGRAGGCRGRCRCRWRGGSRREGGSRGCRAGCRSGPRRRTSSQRRRGGGRGRRRHVRPGCVRGRACPVRAENPVHGPDQQSCSPGIRS